MLIKVFILILFSVVLFVLSARHKHIGPKFIYNTPKIDWEVAAVPVICVLIIIGSLIALVARIVFL